MYLLVVVGYCRRIRVMFGCLAAGCIIAGAGNGYPGDGGGGEDINEGRFRTSVKNGLPGDFWLTPAAHFYASGKLISG